MRHLQTLPKKLDLNRVEQMIRETETPEYSFSKLIISRIDVQRKRSGKLGIIRRTGIAAASAAILAAGLLVSGYLSPVMAETMRKIPLINHIIMFANELGSQTAGNGAGPEHVILDNDGKVAFLSHDLSYKEIEDEDFRSQLAAAWDEVFPNDSDKPENVNIWYFEHYSVLRAGNETKTIYIVNGKLDYAVQRIKENDVPDSIKKTADRLFGKIGNFKNSTRTEMTLKPKQKPVYNFVYKTDDGEVWVDVEKDTNRITRVFADPLSDQLYKLTSKEEDRSIAEKTKAHEMKKLLKTAVEQANEWMNLDLSGYNAVRHSVRDDTLIFTKEGAPSVTGMFNSKGTFYYFMIQ
ncbi:hypothetical protein J6TS7_10740 [Paenibacillus dendritiformis]|nr:hypothetical protein J6TS7_10740 [Paenibacillus dendritiformis]